MERNVKRYELLIDVSVVDGCWSSLEDLKTYIDYRLNLRSRGSDAVRLNNICVLSEKNIQQEFKL